MRWLIFLFITSFFVWGCSKKSNVDEVPTFTFSSLSQSKLDLSDSSEDPPKIFLNFGYTIRIENKSTPRLLIKQIDLVDKGSKQINYVNRELPEIHKSIKILDAERGSISMAVDRSIFVNKLKLGDSVRWEASFIDFADRKSTITLVAPLVRVN